MMKSESTATPQSPNDLNDYARISAALSYLIENAQEQPALADVARHIGLSEFHFQRLFRRWAGISPKRFLQFLTTRHTREVLKTAPSLLDASLDVGLSGAGRLHDLFVSVLGMTPAEARDGAAGLVITWGVQPTPFGLALFAKTSRGLCNLEFLDNDDTDGRRMDAWCDAVLQQQWPGATLIRNDQSVADVAAKVFSGLSANRDGGVILHVRGTNFQIRVWEALLSLSPGAVISYGDLASHLDLPGGARAVASAVARNPVGYLIPCHRVIRSSGIIGEYRWGSPRKHAILGWESAMNDPESGEYPDDTSASSTDG